MWINLHIHVLESSFYLVFNDSYQWRNDDDDGMVGVKECVIILSINLDFPKVRWQDYKNFLPLTNSTIASNS